MSKIIISKRKAMVTSDGVTIALSRKEFDLLSYFTTNRDLALTKQDIISVVWSEVYTTDRTVDIYVYKLRKKLGSDIIETIKSYGYKLIGDVEFEEKPIETEHTDGKYNIYKSPNGEICTFVTTADTKYGIINLLMIGGKLVGVDDKDLNLFYKPYND